MALFRVWLWLESLLSHRTPVDRELGFILDASLPRLLSFPVLRQAASDRSFKADVFVRCIKMYDQSSGAFSLSSRSLAPR